MLDRFVPLIALRYFKAKKNERFVSIISGVSLAGIAIGVAALIIVMSVMNGFHIELTNNIVGLNGDITITAYDKIIKDHEDVIKKLTNYKFVKKVIPLVSGQAMVLGDGANSGAIIKGIDIVDLKHKGEIIQNTLEGSFIEYSGTNVVAVGSGLARNLGIEAGSKVKMIAPNLLSTAFGSMPRSKDFTVVAIFNSGLYDYDAATILMPLAAAQKFLSCDNGVNLLEIHVDNQEEASNYSKLLQKDFLSLNVRSWMHDNKQFLSALAVERTAMFTILSLIILVAAFNIVSSLFMLVKDKTKDVAILKTIGASFRQIMLIFMLNGLFVGVIGTISGVTIGLLFSYNIENIRKFLEQISGTTIFDPAIYFLYSLPSTVRLEDVVIIATIAILLSLVATIYPAYRGAVLNPVEALRYE